MTGETVKAVLASALGYVFVVMSAFAMSTTIGVVTGYYPSLQFFTLALITFRMIEINHVFLIVPPLVAMFVTALLYRMPMDRRIAGGLGLASYYILVGVIFATIGGGDLPYEILIIWVALVFLFGFLSTAAIDTVISKEEKFCPKCGWKTEYNPLCEMPTGQPSSCCN